MACVFCIASLAVDAHAGRRAALVIGNDAYPGNLALQSCVKDAEAFAAWLDSVGFEPGEIDIRTDATKARMVDGFEQLIARTGRQHHDQVVIYFSGHGAQVTDDNGDEGRNDNKDESLCGIDDPATLNAWDELVIRDDDFNRFVERISQNTDQVFIVFDCCFSGGALKNVSPFYRPRGKSKRITESELYHLFQGAKKSVKGLNPHPEPRTKNAPRSRPSQLTDLSRFRSAKSVVFISASSEWEPASANLQGQELSAFTHVFLDIVESGAKNDGKPLKIKEVLKKVQAELAGIQSPIVLTSGISDEVPLVSDVFPTAGTVRQQRKLAEVIAQLVSLPPRLKSPDWTVTATSRPDGAINIGELYDLRVTPNQTGYLVVLTLEVSGEVTLFFPNQYFYNNQVGAGEEKAIPFENGLKAEAPAGEEHFYIYLLEKNPFDGYRFEKGAAALLFGDVSDIVRRNPALDDVDQLIEVLTNGSSDIVDVEASASKLGRWGHAVVTVRTR